VSPLWEKSKKDYSKKEIIYKYGRVDEISKRFGRNFLAQSALAPSLFTKKTDSYRTV